MLLELVPAYIHMFVWIYLWVHLHAWYLYIYKIRLRQDRLGWGMRRRGWGRQAVLCSWGLICIHG